MRSIRLSLLVWFLSLLTVAVGSAAFLTDRVSHQTMLAKKDATHKLIEAQYNERCKEARKNFDKELIDQGRSLARATRFSPDVRQLGYGQLHWLGVLTTGFTPGSYVCVPTWLAEAEETAVSDELANRDMLRWRTFTARLRFTDQTVLEHLDEQPDTYFQIDTDRGYHYFSKSLAGEKLPNPVLPILDKEEYPRYADSELGSGHQIRRVILKLPLSRFVVGRPSRESLQPPEIYVQCGRDLAPLEAALTDFTQRRDQELDDLRGRTEGEITSLRTRLTAIGIVTLLAGAVGSIWIVRHGLAPLRRLSDAVSRVSPRRLQLSLEPQQLPAELRLIVDRLKESLGQLGRAFEREKQATADISHELRTPLSALLTTTEVALRKQRSVEEYCELLGDCRLNAQQMNGMVERLLTLARLDAGVDHLRTQAVDASALAQQCADMVRPLAESHHLKLTVHRKGPISLRTDPDKLREVISNLLHNAIQYNRPHGSIDLYVNHVNERLMLEVCDTGIGIPPEVREQIFERFFRVDPSRSVDGLHSGLGLAIVKEYVQLLGGTVSVESAVGQGSTFRVDLPIATAQSPVNQEKRGGFRQPTATE